ncbi:MAG: hypothetical protein U0736_25700 [Gemmataceae bacterium]
MTNAIDAGAEFLRHLHAYRPVKAACWLREGEDEERYLYVALDGLAEDNTDAAYMEVLRITQRMKDHYLDPFRVKLIRTSDPIAQAVMDLHRRFPGRIPPPVYSRVFAGTAVAEVYVYPDLHAKP